MIIYIAIVTHDYVINRIKEFRKYYSKISPDFDNLLVAITYKGYIKLCLKLCDKTHPVFFIPIQWW